MSPAPMDESPMDKPPMNATPTDEPPMGEAPARDTPETLAAEDPGCRRSEPRLPRREQAFVRVLLGQGQTVTAHTADVSANGFSVLLPAALEPGLILHVVIHRDTTGDRYLLAAESRWCRPDGDAFRAGFILLDAEESDLPLWQQGFAEP